jgi:hypothetical protein
LLWVAIVWVLRGAVVRPLSAIETTDDADSVIVVLVREPTFADAQ